MSNQHTTINHLNKARNVLERVQSVETVLFGEFDNKTGEQKSVGAIESLSKNIDVTRNQLSGLAEVLDAVVRAVGVAEIERIVAESRIDNARKEAGEQQHKLATLVAEGKVVAVDAIGADSIVVGVEATPDGKVVEPGWFIHPMSSIKEKNREELLNKSAGFSITTDSGNTYTVKEIYEVNKNPPEVQAASSGPKVESTVELMPPSLSSTTPQE
jgi:hypothetical protein